MRKTNILFLTALATFLYVLVGCSPMEVKDFKPTSRDDIKPGPGLISGEDGYIDLVPGGGKK